MGTIELFKKLLTLKPLFHFDIEVEKRDEEEHAHFFKECERRGLIPKWLDCEVPTIRVTNCAGATKIQKAVARLNSKDMAHINGLLVASGIRALNKFRCKEFCALFERERYWAKKNRDEKWEKIYRAFSTANEMQVESIIQSIR